MVAEREENLNCGGKKFFGYLESYPNIAQKLLSLSAE